jgi:hypothetical protein
MFGLQDGASVSTTGSLVNNGTLSLDARYPSRGGSNLTVAGTLTNSGSLTIGGLTVSASDKVTAASLDNTGFTGVSSLLDNQALLDVTTGVAGFGTAEVLSGAVTIGDTTNIGGVLPGPSAIEFASGQITTIAAASRLTLVGPSVPALTEDSRGWANQS